MPPKKAMATISLKDIMRGEGATPVKVKGRKMKPKIEDRSVPVEMEGGYLPGQVSDSPSMEGGKVSVKRVVRGARRVYRKHVRPAVTATLKQLKPIAQEMASATIEQALSSQGVPPTIAAAAGDVAGRAAASATSDVLNQTGVTKGLGLKIPNFNVKIDGNNQVTPVYLGAGMVTPQTSSINKAVFSASNMSGIVQQDSPMHAASMKQLAIPAQMRSKTFTNMSVGRGLYMGGGLYLAGGRGLY